MASHPLCVGKRPYILGREEAKVMVSNTENRKEFFLNLNGLPEESSAERWREESARGAITLIQALLWPQTEKGALPGSLSPQRMVRKKERKIYHETGPRERNRENRGVLPSFKHQDHRGVGKISERRQGTQNQENTRWIKGNTLIWRHRKRNPMIRTWGRGCTRLTKRRKEIILPLGSPWEGGKVTL